MHKNERKKLLADIPFDLAGSLIFSTGLLCFTAPNEIAPGGVSGLATIINFLFHIPIGLASFLLNIPLLLLALRFLGRGFTVRTLKSVAILSLVLDIVLPFIPVYRGDPILAALFGGVFMGAGLGLVFMRGSTTGGTDIASLLIQRKFPHLSIGRILLITDLFVLLLAALVYKNIETLLYGLIAIFTQTKMIDGVLYGLDSGRLAIVVSQKEREIAEVIMEQLGRGVTFLEGEGAYLGEKRRVLLCALRTRQFARLKKMVYSIDPTAFVIVTEASEILGDGFKLPEEK